MQVSCPRTKGTIYPLVSPWTDPLFIILITIYKYIFFFFSAGECEKLFQNLPLQQDEKYNNIAEKQNTTDTYVLPTLKFLMINLKLFTFLTLHLFIFRKSVEIDEILLTPLQYLSRSLANVLISAPTESSSEYITKKIDFNDGGLGDPNYFVNIYSSNTSRAETTNNTDNFKRSFDIDSSIFGSSKQKIYQNRQLIGYIF